MSDLAQNEPKGVGPVVSEDASRAADGGLGVRVAPERRRGRAAVSNAAGRFDLAREAVDDGWGPPEGMAGAEPAVRREVSEEATRSLINYVRSPDLPFDRSINPYRGCEHGCIYCFARPSHAYLGLSPGLDFETRLIARPDAAAVLRRELRARNYRVAPIAIGTNTDPYQPIERERGIMRACLEVLEEAGHPVAIVTKGAGIERDLDILGRMATRGLARVGISVTTLDADLSRKMEPRVPSPARRLAAIERVRAAGVPVRVMVSPIIPALTDPELETILEAARDAGADAASWVMLRLPREVSVLFREWLDEVMPGGAGRIMARVREMHGGKDYDAQWGRRMRGEGVYAALIAQRFDKAIRRLGLETRSPPLRTDLYRRPEEPGDQLSLF
ncbi:PA0069 family radical SAM protein [Poseidonocella sedimentorum]|uniref:DNA repair photolyase n=1 Tax=Poseidonocella sedimentorum TaxID=871652 RepID=A0A1I6DDE7_9RHOB|nr:PA0069 family radical SAM protein [Poseidonocella sedimentorum]SFR03417.1 DNA repair photolyase [Poseidonocella sedimentorum]